MPVSNSDIKITKKIIGELYLLNGPIKLKLLPNGVIRATTYNPSISLPLNYGVIGIKLLYSHSKQDQNNILTKYKQKFTYARSNGIDMIKLALPKLPSQAASNNKLSTSAQQTQYNINLYTADGCSVWQGCPDGCDPALLCIFNCC
jgi:hypothetical protein